MRYKLLGKSGLRVSELALGTMTFGEDWGWGASYEESRKIFEKFSEAGGNFIDTANRYTDGSAEKFVGEFIAAEREKYVVATKYSLFMRRGDPNAAGNGRKNMVQALDASLKRLNTDYIDLYWLHAWDFMTPVEEVMRALDDMVSAGKVLYIGISDTPAWIVSRANAIAELRGWSQFVGLQVEYSLIERTVERDLTPMAEALGLAVTAWAPMGSGLLTGKYSQPVPAKDGSPKRINDLGMDSRLNEKNMAIAAQVDKIAAEIGCTSSQVALNWVRKQPGTVIPIIGTRRADQLQENLDCLKFDLSAEQLARLDKVSAIEKGFPHDFLASDGIRDIVYGGTYDLIDRK
jgi:aryl-alcohol dehydrogenase-like predicted oxidoreductase